MRKLKQAGVTTYQQNHIHLKEKEESKIEEEKKEENKQTKMIKEVDPYLLKGEEDENPFQKSDDIRTPVKDRNQRSFKR